MPKIDRGLMESTRAQAKKFHAEMARGERKTGKEQVRETAYKNMQKNVGRRNALLQKFVTEEGKGSATNIVT